ncbi:hypothetical protein WUBG_13343, partial [Wuchereria bancrofti]
SFHCADRRYPQNQLMAVLAVDGGGGGGAGATNCCCEDRCARKGNEMSCFYVVLNFVTDRERIRM